MKSLTDEAPALSKRAEQFQSLLQARGLDFRVLELPDSARTADDAAAALGCDKAQIVKSLIFRHAETDEPILILASGVNRVDEQHIESKLGVTLAKADAKFVKKTTGYSIGGVPPIGHKTRACVLVDKDLLAHDLLWAAAGTPKIGRAS